MSILSRIRKLGMTLTLSLVIAANGQETDNQAGKPDADLKLEDAVISEMRSSGRSAFEVDSEEIADKQIRDLQELFQDDPAISIGGGGSPVGVDLPRWNKHCGSKVVSIQGIGERASDR